MLTSIEHEQLVIGHVLLFGQSAANLLLTEQDNPLLADSFFGGETLFGHRQIWEAITEETYTTSPDYSPAYLAGLRSGLNFAYLNNLIAELPVKFGIKELNPDSLFDWARAVYDSGRLRTAQWALEKSSLDLKDPDQLIANGVDVDEVIGNLLTNVSQATIAADNDYLPISVAVNESLQLIKYLEEGVNPYLLTTGWPSFDNFNLLPKGELTVVQGESSVGKTQLAFQWALGVAIHLRAYNLPGVVAVNSVEMTQRMLTVRLACSLSGVDWREAQQHAGYASLPKLKRAMAFLDTLPIRIDDSSALTSSQLKSRAAKLNLQHGPIHLIVTDYGQLFADVAPSKVEAVTQIFRNQKALAKDLGCAIVAISQVTLDKFNKSRLPAPDEGRWSKDIRNDADALMSVWNPVVYGEQHIPFESPIEGRLDLSQAHIFVQKFRNGKVGIISMDWESRYTRFSDPALSATHDNIAPLYRNLRILDGEYIIVSDDGELVDVQ